MRQRHESSMHWRRMHLRLSEILERKSMRLRSNHKRKLHAPRAMRLDEAFAMLFLQSNPVPMHLQFDLLLVELLRQVSC